MGDKIRAYGRIALVIIVLILIALAVFFAYSWFTANYGDTAKRAAEEYFTALGAADYDTLYALTPDASLTDPFGRKISPTDFASQVRGLSGGKLLTIKQTVIEQLAEREGAFYFKVTLLYEIGGTSKSRVILIEVVQEGGEWKVTYPFIASL
ncbi:MAG: hypothetical protein HYX86_00165 [Chloroflexi bacterium]|nr:hypothetical protein [Chloroflexota bacterium]